MSDIAIKVENISKRYRIGLKEELHDTFFGALASWVKYPLTNFRRVQKLSNFNGNDDSEDIIWALRDVSFELKRGKVLGIIGKNGAGKSTLLKILCRITEPTSGRAEVHGRVASLLEVGTGFHPELTGRENIFLNGTILGMKKVEIDRKFDKIVDFSGVEKFINTPVKRYSSGMAMRLAFSIAAHLEPEILLIDEVLAVGDAAFQDKCLDKMESVAKEGRTVLFVSHNLGVIRNLCDRAILIDKGTIVEDGDVSNVIDAYLVPESGDKMGKVSWPSLDAAPGDERVRLKEIRIMSEGKISNTVIPTKPFNIEIEYWNLQAGIKLFIYIEVYDVNGVFVFETGNWPSLCIEKDEWFEKEYPRGLFCTKIIIPSYFLNQDKKYYINVKIFKNNLPEVESSDHIVVQNRAISFEVINNRILRREILANYTSTAVVLSRYVCQTSQIDT